MGFLAKVDAVKRWEGVAGKVCGTEGREGRGVPVMSVTGERVSVCVRMWGGERV